MKKASKLTFLIIILLMFMFQIMYANTNDSFVQILNFNDIQENKHIIGRDIKIEMDKKLDTSKFNNKNIKLFRSETGEELEIELSYDEPYIIIHPMDKFVPLKNSVDLKGVKPNTKYMIKIDTDKIRSIDGEILSKKYAEITFTTENLNYGVYWFGRDGYCQKYIEGVENRYYDPEKSVILHTHGWEVNKTRRDYWMDQPYIINKKYYNRNIANDWIDAGYNIGVWFWGQFADETDVRDAEAKIWLGDNGRKGMRYRIRKRVFFEFSTDRSIHELFYDDYIKALKEFSGKEIRLTGHSLGNQLVTALSNKISEEIDNENLDWKYMPSRITLLDPYWTNFKKLYINSKTTSDLCTEIMRKLISEKGIVVEEIKSSGLGNKIIGSDNLELRKLTAFVRIWSSRMPAYLIMERHTYSTDWYYMTIRNELKTENGAIGAKAKTEEVRDTMNYYKRKKTYLLQTKGFNTLSSKNDYFDEISGIITY